MSISYPMTDEKPAILGRLETFKRRVNGVGNAFLNIPDAAAELPAIAAQALQYKKRGGLHFAKIGNASVSWSFKRAAKPVAKAIVAPVVVEIPALLSDRINRFVK